MSAAYPDPDEVTSLAEACRQRVEATIQESRALREEAASMRAATRRALALAARELQAAKQTLAYAQNPAGTERTR